VIHYISFLVRIFQILDCGRQSLDCKSTSGLVIDGYGIIKLCDTCTECTGSIVRTVQIQSVGFYVAICTHVTSVAMIMAIAIFTSICTVCFPYNNTMILVKLFLTTLQCQSSDDNEANADSQGKQKLT